MKYAQWLYQRIGQIVSFAVAGLATNHLMERHSDEPFAVALVAALWLASGLVLRHQMINRKSD